MENVVAHCLAELQPIKRAGETSVCVVDANMAADGG